MDFSSVPKAILTTFGFMLGGFQIAYFYHVDPETGIPAAILFMVYQVLINVTLLNILVAIMIEAYSKVGHHGNPFCIVVKEKYLSSTQSVEDSGLNLVLPTDYCCSRTSESYRGARYIVIIRGTKLSSTLLAR